MTQDIFDDRQFSAMTMAIDQIMRKAGEASGVNRVEVAQAVFNVCVERSSVLEPSDLAKLAVERLVQCRREKVAF